jgi:alcohol dehydrogenase class IV
MNANTVFELRKFVAPEFVYGVGALNFVGRYAKNFGARKALVVTDPGIIEAGWLEKATDSLDGEQIPWAVFQELTPNPKDGEVTRGVEYYQENACDVIVAVGGGSSMDCAKGIGIAFANRKNVLEFEGVDEVPMPGPPLICVPTTAGSSADVSQFAIIVDTRRNLKLAIISKTVVPDISLIDPETTTSMPAELTAATGMDALTHAIEAYVSNASSPVTDIHALAAIPLLTQYMAPAIENPKNMEFRHQMMLGSLLAGLAFSNAGLGLVHAMAHSIGGLLDSPHGVCNTLLLEHVVSFNYSSSPERYDRIGSVMGVKFEETGPESRKEALLQRLTKLREDAGIHTRIDSLGVTSDHIHQLSINAFNDPCLATNPRTVSIQEIGELYERALSP